jgi:REP element-mobilizing transposase RayT
MGARLWVALCMPDHLHMMVEGGASNADLWSLVVKFKQRTGWFFTRNKVKGRWQKDFYDHILRDEDDLENQARYILNNPVRSGLVDHWLEYPHKLSTVLDLTKRF